MERELLTRYLRQLAELGGNAIYLDSMRASEVVDGLRVAGCEFPPATESLQGAAAVVGDLAVTAQTARPTSDEPQPATRNPQPRAATPTEVGEGDGSGRVGSPLETLAAEAASCLRCRLHEGRRTVVFGEGAADARLVVVGEAPGHEEDRTGRPFVGPAGRMLDLLLMSGGFPRASVYICNVLKCRPPKNRDPLPDEVAICTSAFLRPQLDAIAPRAVLAVGKFAAQSLVGSDESIGRLRGRVHSYRGVPLVVTYHPAFLLRTPRMARAAWDDVQLVRKVLDEQA